MEDGLRKTGGPLLFVCVLNPSTPPKDMPPVDVITREGPEDHRRKRKQYYDNVVINHRGTEAAFRVLLIPFKLGEELPGIVYDAAAGEATIKWSQKLLALAHARGNVRSHIPSPLSFHVCRGRCPLRLRSLPCSKLTDTMATGTCPSAT